MVSLYRDTASRSDTISSCVWRASAAISRKFFSLSPRIASHRVFSASASLCSACVATFVSTSRIRILSMSSELVCCESVHRYMPRRRHSYTL